MIRRLNTIFAADDERRFSELLQDAVPAVRFVEGTLWPREKPPTVSTIADAAGYRILLWNTELFPELPWGRDLHGRIEGPATRYVIDYARCRLVAGRGGEPDILVSGGLAWSSGTPSPEEVQFQRTVWRTARKSLPVPIRVVSGERPSGFAAGEHAAQWWRADPHGRAFGLSGTRLLAVPETAQP